MKNKPKVKKRGENVQIIYRMINGKERYEGTVTKLANGWEYKNVIGRRGVVRTERKAFAELGFKLL